MKICIITDTYPPTINGVSTTLKHVHDELVTIGHELLVIDPSKFITIPSGYPGVRFAVDVWKISEMIKKFSPDSIHIATEGPLGIYGRFYCKRNGFKITTSFHTKFAEYLKKMYRVPEFLTYGYLKWFHSYADKILVTTNSMKKALSVKGFESNKMIVWNRGVRNEVFCFDGSFVDRNIALYFGRVSTEKNIEAFLDLDLDMEKWVIGDGPILCNLKKKYPDVKFFGSFSHGKELSSLISQATVKVFPSLTDTFGVVILEANSCGVPVAAYPVEGPIDVINNGINGYLDNDLKKAILMAKSIDRNSCRKFAIENTWEKCAIRFFDNLVKIIF